MTIMTDCQPLKFTFALPPTGVCCFIIQGSGAEAPVLSLDMLLRGAGCIDLYTHVHLTWKGNVDQGQFLPTYPEVSLRQSPWTSKVLPRELPNRPVSVLI